MDTLLRAMAGDDEYLFDDSRRGAVREPQDLDLITYRQRVLRDCLGQPDAVRQLYELAVDTIAGEKKIWGLLLVPDAEPESCTRSVNDPRVHRRAICGRCAQLARRARRRGSNRTGSRVLFACRASELDDDYFASIEDHLKRLQLPLRRADQRRGSATATRASTTCCVARGTVKRSFVDQIVTEPSASYSFTRIADARRGSACRRWPSCRDRGINLVANALAQSTDHILELLRDAAGRTRLLSRLPQPARAARREAASPPCFPTPPAAESRPFSGAGSLRRRACAWTSPDPVVGNDVGVAASVLVLITGANQGGKSTFLRSIGLAQLMLQAGMFVAADSFTRQRLRPASSPTTSAKKTTTHDQRQARRGTGTG